MSQLIPNWAFSYVIFQSLFCYFPEHYLCSCYENLYFINHNYVRHRNNNCLLSVLYTFWLNIMWRIIFPALNSAKQITTYLHVPLHYTNSSGRPIATHFITWSLSCHLRCVLTLSYLWYGTAILFFWGGRSKPIKCIIIYFYAM